MVPRLTQSWTCFGSASDLRRVYVSGPITALAAASDRRKVTFFGRRTSGPCSGRKEGPQGCNWSPLRFVDLIVNSGHVPMLERVLERSMMAFLLRMERLARDRSAVTRVMEILWEGGIASHTSAPPLTFSLTSKNIPRDRSLLSTVKCDPCKDLRYVFSECVNDRYIPRPHARSWIMNACSELIRRESGCLQTGNQMAALFEGKTRLYQPAIEPVFEEVEQRFLHHVGYLGNKTLNRLRKERDKFTYTSFGLCPINTNTTCGWCAPHKTNTLTCVPSSWSPLVTQTHAPSALFFEPFWAYS